MVFRFRFYFILFLVILCIGTLQKVELSHKSASLAQMDSSIVGRDAHHVGETSCLL